MKNNLMKKIAIFLVICLLFTCAYVGATNAGENPKTCPVCKMDLADAPKSRMIVVFTDGTTVEVCSLHCAVWEMDQNKDKQVKSIMAADYATEEMIDARTATWVVGGDEISVMNDVPKWAFAKEEDAQKFVKEHGGKVATFDEAMKAAAEEVALEGGHLVHRHPGGQMVYNPAFGDDIYHTHPAGMWMFTYKNMYENMRGLLAGTNTVDTHSVGWMSNKPYDYMMIPTSMDMHMNMFMAMYGVTDNLTLMGMANYEYNEMQMVMNMGMGKPYMTQSTMKTEGSGDTELRGLYKINKYLVGSLGLSIPTGSIKQTDMMMGKAERAPYDMQLGSGTWDLKPALTYNALSSDYKWNWGGQAMYTYHTGTNSAGYSLGDEFKATSWLQRAFGPATTWVRLAYSDTGRISGQDPQIQLSQNWAPAPDGDPRNYGGQRLDGLIGVNIVAGRLTFGVEGGIPLYQNLNGLQLKTKFVINSGIQVMF
ncbi:MAG: nitrous oxide reductase accessory protein NosL [Dissulfurispiraceae bacterium]|jgi:nitrous oxide reductase accessory protein NosL